MNKTFNRNFTLPEIILVALVGILGTVYWAIHSGQDLGPDLVNYHFYDAYVAFHKKRLLNDIFPAGIQGYLNPYIYVLIFGLYKILPPIWVGAVIGALHGLCFICVYFLARIILANWSVVFARMTAFLCAAFGTINPFFLAMVGSSFSDNLTPPLILIPLGLVMLVRFPAPIESNQNRYFYQALGLSGLLIGFSVGFKLCNCAYVFGLCAAWLIDFRFSRQMILGTFLLFGCVFLGFLLVNGEWMWRLYSEFQSPMFPFYNHIFKSPMIGEIDTNVPAWAAAHSLRDFFAYPYRWAQGIPPKSEWQFQDARFAILYTLLGTLIILRLVPFFKKIKILQTEADPQFINHRYLFIAVWSIVSYLFWIDQFGALRYLMPVSLLTGILILLCLIKIIPNRKIASTIWLFLAIFSLTTMHTAYFGRVKWKNSWYPVKIPQELLASKDTLYLKNSLSFIIPFFPKDADFIGLGYLSLNGKFIERGREILANHKGPLRTLTLMPMQDTSFYDQLKTYDLRLDARDCVSFKGGVYPFLSCRVERIAENPNPIIIPLSTVLRFDEPQSPWIEAVKGFNSQEQSGFWTEGDTAEIYLAGSLPKHFKININVTSLIGDNLKLPFKIIIGNQEKEVTFKNALTSPDIFFTLNTKNADKIIIKVPKPTSPHDLDAASGDTRKLGMLLHSISIS